MSSLGAQTNTNTNSSVAPFVITTVFQSGNAVPGDTNTNDTFVSFGSPAFNATGGVAFQATVVSSNTIFWTNIFTPFSITSPAIQKHKQSNPLTNIVRIDPIYFPLFTNWSGIWADDAAGNLNLVARTGQAAPGLTSAFTSFSDPVYNNSNAVAFVGKTFQVFNYARPINNLLPIGGHYPTNPGTGVWTTQIFAGTNNINTNRTNGLTLVAAIGTPAPGFSNNATFSSFDQIALPDQGGVVMLASVSTTRILYPPRPTNPAQPLPLYVIVQPVTQQGIWAQDTMGNLNMIAHVGGSISLNGTNKTIAALSFLNGGNQPSAPIFYPLLGIYNSSLFPSNTSSPVNGQTRSFDQETGNFIFKATFTDGTQATLKVTFP